MDHVIDRGKRGYVSATKPGRDGGSWKSWGSGIIDGRNTTVMYCRSWDRGQLAPDI
ncbi:hypothetical protein A2U01_0069586, partial [Trifolium medium]|nr:hypothetical protein [Trifolium medium]